MISIVVCSVNDTLFENFSSSVADTIGVEYELIRINNSDNKHSICQAYNIGAAGARFDYLCFAHEDILFRSKNWGSVLVDIFKHDDKAGVVGVAGSKYKSLAPSGWPTGVGALDCYNLVQRYDDSTSLQTHNQDDINTLAEVKVLDGVLLFTKKQVWQNNKFDADTFKHFHCYDLDFCLQVSQTHKILVCYDVLIEHLSTGSENRAWITNSILLAKKWQHYLPVGQLPYKEKVKVEWYQKRLFALKMRIHGFSTAQIISVFFGFGYFKFFGLAGNVSFVKEIIKSVLKKITK